MLTIKTSSPKRPVKTSELDRLIKQKAPKTFSVRQIPKTKILIQVTEKHIRRIHQWVFYFGKYQAFNIVLLQNGDIEFVYPESATFAAELHSLRLRLMRALAARGRRIEEERVARERPTAWDLILRDD